MRFMMLVKAQDKYQEEPPPPGLMEAMEKIGAEATQAGQMIDTGGLAPTSQGLRVRLEGGKIRLTDGPFTEAKEVVGGYAIMEFKTKEEMIESVTNFMELHRQYWPEFEGETEVRQIFTTPEEFGWDK